MKSMISLAVLAPLALVAACGDDEGGTDDPAPDAAVTVDAPEPDAPPPIDAPPPDAAPATRIAATVAYDGDAEGSLILAVFTSFPPSGPPIGFAQDATPEFPAALTVDDVPAGTLYVLALLDVAPASPTQPGPEDRQAWSEALTIVEGETTNVELTLEDP